MGNKSIDKLELELSCLNLPKWWKMVNHQEDWESIAWVHKPAVNCSAWTLEPSEIRAHLHAEAIKRGMHYGTEWIGVRSIQKSESYYDGDTEKTIKAVYSNEKPRKVGSILCYNHITDTLYSAGFGVIILYEQDKWATKL